MGQPNRRIRRRCFYECFVVLVVATIRGGGARLVCAEEPVQRAASSRGMDTAAVRGVDPKPTFSTVGGGATGKIVGGELVAELGKYPFFSITFNSFVCGSFLVWPDVLVSAAHCVAAFDTTDSVAQIGGTIVRPSNAPELRSIPGYTQHPQFQLSLFRNDIMVLYLNATSNAPVVALNTNNDLPADNQTATVIGHGRTIESERFVSNELKEAVVAVIPTADCDTNYSTTPDTAIQSNVSFCATRVTGVSCNGDSGGPLIDTTTGAVIGIVSFGASTGCTRGPSGYTRVAPYADWVLDAICTHSLVKPTTQCENRTIATPVVLVPSN